MLLDPNLHPGRKNRKYKVGKGSNQYVVINNDLGICTLQYSNHLLQIEKERYPSF
jgi:hypothetical protein